MLFTILKDLAYFVGIYVAGAIGFLLLARLEKDAEGNLLFDPTRAWHFKLAYPVKRRDERFVQALQEDGLNICPYYRKLFWMIFVGWPVIIVWETLKTLLYNSVFLLFGYYCVSDLEEMAHGRDPGPFLMRVEHIDWFSKKFMPIYLVLPAAYLWSLYYRRSATVHASLNVLLMVLACGTIIGAIVLVSWLSTTKEHRVSLTREWATAKTKRFCKTLKAKPVSVPVAQ